MSNRFFRLTEIHQKIDDRLRIERQRRSPDPMVLRRLATLKHRTKRLLGRMIPRAA